MNSIGDQSQFVKTNTASPHYGGQAPAYVSLIGKILGKAGVEGSRCTTFVPIDSKVIPDRRWQYCKVEEREGNNDHFIFTIHPTGGQMPVVRLWTRVTTVHNQKLKKVLAELRAAAREISEEDEREEAQDVELAEAIDAGQADESITSEEDQPEATVSDEPPVGAVNDEENSTTDEEARKTHLIEVVQVILLNRPDAGGYLAFSFLLKLVKATPDFEYVNSGELMSLLENELSDRVQIRPFAQGVSYIQWKDSKWLPSITPGQFEVLLAISRQLSGPHKRGKVTPKTFEPFLTPDRVHPGSLASHFYVLRRSEFITVYDKSEIEVALEECVVYSGSQPTNGKRLSLKPEDNLLPVVTTSEEVSDDSRPPLPVAPEEDMEQTEQAAVIPSLPDDQPRSLRQILDELSTLKLQLQAAISPELQRLARIRTEREQATKERDQAAEERDRAAAVVMAREAFSATLLEEEQDLYANFDFFEATQYLSDVTTS